MRKLTQSTHRPLASSLAKLPSAVAICTVLAIASSATANAATYYWDADGDVVGNNIGTGAGLGGIGTWTNPFSVTPTAAWFAAGAPANIVWPNSDPSTDTAIFTGTGGAVALDGAIVVNTLRFNSNGYSITNGGNAANYLVLSGTTPTIDVLTSGHNVTLTARVDGFDGLRKTGAGTLTLGATGNSFTGDILVEGGTLAFVGSGNADQTALGIGPKTITLTNNATLAVVGNTDADPNVAGGKGFVIGTGGGTIDVAASRTFFLNDGVSNNSFQNQLQGAGTLTKAGAGTLNVGRDFASTFTGDVFVKDGRLDITVANAVGNVGTITVDGTLGAGTTSAARLNFNSTTAFAFTNNLVLQNGGVLSMQGANHNLPNTKTITIGSGTSRIRVDDGSSAAANATNRTFVLNGALNGSNTVEVAGPTGASRGVLAISNTASNFSGTIVIDKNVSVENFARWDGTTATNTGKTIGTATIKFQALTNGSGSTVDGQLDLRDSGTGNNQVFNYGNNVDMSSTGGTIAVGTNTSAAVASTGGRFVLGNLTLGGGNTLTVNTTNGYSLDFGGSTTLSGSGNATIATTPNMTLAGGITGTGGLIKSGAGLLTVGALPAGTSAYAGSTAINAGGIIFNGETSLGGTGASVTLANNTFIGANFVATQANLIDRLVANANTSVIALGQNTSANLNLSTLPNARLGAVGTATYTGTLTQAGSTTLLGGGGGTLILPGTNIISGTRNLDVGSYGTPAGVVALDEPQNFTGSITLSGGQLLRIGGNTSLGNAANVITANGGGIQFKDAASGYDIFATRTINFTGGFILDTNGYDYTPTVAVGGTAGVGNFTKAGAGKLTLNIPVTYNGKTIITGGTLSIAADNILGAAPSSNTADQLQIQSGGTLEVTGAFTIPVQRGVQLTNGGGAIRVTGSNTLTLASNTSGNGQLTKEGTGTLLITTDPNHTGGFTINNGILALQHSGSTDGHFVINNTGTLQVLTANDLGDSYNVTVNTGGVFDLRASDTIAQLFGSGMVTNGGTAGATLTVSSATNTTFTGTLTNGSNSAATLGFGKSGASTVTFTGKNTNTGTTSINTGQIRVEGASARLNNGGVVSIGDNNGNDESLVLGLNTDVVSDVFDKIGDTAEIEFRGSTLATINGPAVGSTAFTETMGNIDFRDGVGIFTLNPTSGGQLQVNAGTITRELGTGTGVIRGTNLGGTGADSSRVMLSSTAGVFVGSGGTGSLASIIPFVIGGTSTTAAPDTFLTYNATNGLTPLKATDYASTIAGSTGRNVSIPGGETITANTSINALRVTGGNTTLTGAQLGISSGAILFTGTGSIDGTGTIDAGDRPVVIQASGDTTSITGTLNVNLTARNGLAVGDAGDIGHTIELNGSNRILGGVTINGGALRLGSPNALGIAGEPINELTLKAGNNATGGALSSVLQLGGNNLTVQFNSADRLQGSTRIQNASPTPATLTVITNAASASNDGVLENGTGGGALSFVKLGTAQLTLEQTNSYTGTTEILGGTVQLNTANGRFSGTTGITIAGGSILNLNNTNSANQGDRLANGAAISMQGGQLQFDNNQNAANYAETAGALNSILGSNQIMSDFAAANQTSTLTFASLAVSSGSALHFTNFGTTGDIAIGEGGTRNRVIFTTDPTATNGIIGGNVYFTKNFATATTFDTVDFASYDFDTDGTGADVENGIVVFSGYNTGAENTWTNTSVIRPAASATLTANRDVYAAKLDLGVDLTVGAGRTLNVVSGGIIYNPNTTNASTSTIADGKLTSSNGELAIRVDGNLNAATLAISSEIADNANGPVSVLKSGADTLALNGVNTYTGVTTIVEGAVRIAADSGLGAVPTAPTSSSIRLHGGTLEIADTMTLNANRGIELGGGLPTISVPLSTATLSYNGSFSAVGNSAGADLTIRGNVAFGGTVNSIPVGLNVASNMVAGLATNSSTVTFAPTSGTLSIGLNNPTIADLNVGYRPFAPSNDTAGQATVGTLDLQALTTFNAQIATLRLGVLGVSGGSNATAKGDLLLPATSTISAWNGVLIGDSTAAGNNGPQSSLRFGAGESTLTTTSLIAGGRKGNGLVTIASGGKLTLKGFESNTADLFVAYNNQDNTGVTSSGTADFSGGTLLADLDELVVGFKNGAGGSTGGATGTMTLGTANNKVVANQIRLGDYSGGSSGTASGTLTVGGGSVVVNNDVSLGLYTGTTGGSAGTLNINGGSVVVGGNIVTSNSARATATLNLNGGSLDVTGGDINVDTFNVQAGALRNVNQIYNGDGTTAAALTKSGTGVLEIDGTNTYTGGTSLIGGTLYVNGSINGTLTAASGTTLGGDGRINGPVNIASSGTLAPGTTGVGSLDINGGLTIGNDSTLRIQINGLIAGIGYDQVNMTSTTGSVSLGTNVTLSLSLGFTPNTTVDTFYYILTRDDNGTGFGNLFAGMPEGSTIDLGGGIIGKLTYFANWTGNAATSSFTGGNDVAIAVPEPGTVTTLLGGIAALVGLGRFRRRQSRA